MACRWREWENRLSGGNLCRWRERENRLSSGNLCRWRERENRLSGGNLCRRRERENGLSGGNLCRWRERENRLSGGNLCRRRERENGLSRIRGRAIVCGHQSWLSGCALSGGRRQSKNCDKNESEPIESFGVHWYYLLGKVCERCSG